MKPSTTVYAAKYIQFKNDRTARTNTAHTNFYTAKTDRFPETFNAFKTVDRCIRLACKASLSPKQEIRRSSRATCADAGSEGTVEYESSPCICLSMCSTSV